MKDTKFGEYGYTEIYNSILLSLRNDLVEEKVAIVTAKRLTDAVWDLHLVLNADSDSLNNTVKNIKGILENRLGK